MLGSCSGIGGQPSAADSIDSLDIKVASVVDSVEADTLASLLGRLCGNDIAVRSRSLQADSKETFDNNEFLTGFRVPMSDENHSASYTEGVRSALDILAKIEDFRKYGVEVNKEMLLNALRNQLLADSISDAKMAELNTDYNDLLQRVYSAELQ